ncbi:protein inscuteable homolog [Coccinella septempunctata]|uniref:protein inscuteable homolog n=1 Tax=Coccinella septempunctata TaxID=41139 RepID=UPI001D0968B0|nr:protein inscuteable homolog [Coccinella septempunctata]
MSEFKRSPSKVWWGNDTDLDRINASSSPGSQDSGFSDSEIHNQSNRKSTPKGTLAQRIPKEIFKELSSAKNGLNLSSNYKEKTTPTKSSPILSKPKQKEPSHSDPIRKNRFVKHSPKVSRSLFTRKTYSNELVTNQYSDSDTDYTKHSLTTDSSNDDSNCSSLCDTSLSEECEVLEVKSLQEAASEREFCLEGFLNKSAPPLLGGYSDDEGVTAFNESYSDSECEKELEDLFDDLDSPKHTSTPKACAGMERVKRGGLHMNLLLKFQRERVPPTHIEDSTDDKAVKLWLQENKSKYDTECMISLQSKSIAAELNEKVAYMANSLTAKFREMLRLSNHIESEWRTLNSGEDLTSCETEGLVNSIMYFLKTYNRDLYEGVSRKREDFKVTDQSILVKNLNQLYNVWNSLHQDLCTESVKQLLTKLEYPVSEMDLKATVSAITMVALSEERLMEEFIKYDAVPMLLIHCEKCEGSSTRCLILRALSTMCCIAPAVRQFEKFSGIQLITDILEEDSRPEPEHSEAVTLLAQITAPWVEDNYSIRGLPEYTRRLVKSLTKFLKTTKCCQNLLLCIAALANVSAMDAATTIKYIMNENCVSEILKTIQRRNDISVYVLEQVASLIANVSAIEATRSALIDIRAPVALVCFLQVKNVDETIEKRLQQKVMIALSRLCGDQRAAEQIVEVGGVNRLVKLCREKDDRFNSDAVLVAALASLRKIVETCGKEVISSQDSQELVEPKLLDSFLAYSNQNESYV